MQRRHFTALVLAAAGLLAFHSPATAQTSDQQATPPAADSGHRKIDPVARLLENRGELKITDEQVTRLQAIRTEYLEKHQPQMEELRRDREKRAAFRASLDSTRTEIMAVLTPEQRTRFTELQKGWRREHWGGKHGSGAPNHHKHKEIKPDSTAE